MSLLVGICIATHNRVEELARTLGVIARLAVPPDEVIVVADGCSDGTIERVRGEWPSIRLLVHENPRGSIPARNAMAKVCECEILVSLDDDSYPIEPDFIARVRALFEQHPRLAVASFPQRTDEVPETLTVPNFGPARFTGSYVNSGAAIRRSVFRDLGGYPEAFVHAYEEPDFALRCVAAGWQVRHETSLTVRHHFTSTQRNELRTHHRHARNEIWSVLMRCPGPQLFGVVLFRAARQFAYAWSRGVGWAVREPEWWIDCLRGAHHCFEQRAPLPWSRYLAWMQLVRDPLYSEEAWVAKFGGEMS